MSHKIRFTGHHSGFIELKSFQTGFSLIPAILTLASTRGEYDAKLGGEPFKTDDEGLARLVNISSQAEDSIAGAVEAIGLLLATSEISGVSLESIRELGWLLTGLSELRSIIAEAREDATAHLAQGGYGPHTGPEPNPVGRASTADVRA